MGAAFEANPGLNVFYRFAHLVRWYIGANLPIVRMGLPGPPGAAIQKA